ncbi:dihydrofolate reductase-like domain-containing protein [Aspergillus pseudonomiae]|uniref:2,5-diamino-6-ribosylamino-4(3H)-pyrimidinone 5'-phosphate reductase n=1 Tax=Aspergillus pseudonomiae TaxID=1506151 RepID=A0A5N6I5E0_9EURO|nr:dihydrofolate reductase-like domain-containing protein [Aspergillus pseudonomiae]KAB8261588.1 dihydrofolate reductase-like domain-containing protein [Aspergillus pseudonomiae]KAE8406823.1 dihydrofolate reductase-like domain-containing protein [Aspergillus pseudonomiae]
MSREALTFPPSNRTFLEPHLPPNNDTKPSNPTLPFTTLTFATSLDSSLALAPGTRTTLSGPQSKAMTHYLRSRHDAILIGVGTAVADNPGLNCRIEGVGGYGGEGLLGQPRPIIIDPRARWDFTDKSKILELVKEGKGRAPFIVTSAGTVPAAEKRALLESYGGKFIPLELFVDEHGEKELDWTAVLECLRSEGLKSVMVEGGGMVINSLLEPRWAHLVDSVIVTIAPTWLGQGGVVVSPRRRVEGGQPVPAARLKDVRWYPFGEDVVLCGRV